MHIIVNKEMPIPKGNLISAIDIRLLNTELQSFIKESAPDTQDVYHTNSVGEDYFYIFIGDNKKHPYTRLTIEY